MKAQAPKHRLPGTSYALVLAGGGARGMAHAGVLRALQAYGCPPSALVGVSMGAIVAAAYALNPDWYRALLKVEPPRLPQILTASERGLFERLRGSLAREMTLHQLVHGWGLRAGTVRRIRAQLHDLVCGRSLEESRPPLFVIATDLRSGSSVVLDHGDASEAIYASSALAGLLPPLPRDDGLLADGGYADQAPIQVARQTGARAVVVVDPDYELEGWAPGNGLEAMARALEISMQEHARLLLGEADLILRPRFSLPIRALDFEHKRLAVAAGIRAVRESLPHLRALLKERGMVGDKLVRVL